MRNDSELARAHFFSKQVHMRAWKDSMSGENEERVIEVLGMLGYKLGEDYVRQYPLAGRYVADFAFVKEKVVLEIDGSTHRGKEQRRKDKARDKHLRDGQWATIRMWNDDLFGKKASFFKNLIREVVEERRKQWETGVFKHVDFSVYDGGYEE